MPNPNPNKMSNPNPSSSQNPPIENEEPEDYLSKSEFLTRTDVIDRRSKMLKRLTQVYKHHYWSLMEELKNKHKDYLMEYGRSPFADDQGEEDAEERELCGAHGCKCKAMELTKFCHAHILSDANQKLYKPCGYVIKSFPAGPVYCGKPILRAAVPSLCTVHLEKAEKLVARDLREAGYTGTQSNPTPNLRDLCVEFVRQIQIKRRDVQKANTDNSI